jgi:hypothetical protein
MDNLYLVDRIDCEDEGSQTDIEQLVPKFVELSSRGFAMPTILIRCAGKNSAGPVSSSSTVQAVQRLAEHGSPLGVHVHANSDAAGHERMADLTKPAAVGRLLDEACRRFCATFGTEPWILGMGHTACSNEEVAALLQSFGIRLNLGDLQANKYAFTQKVKLFDYTTAGWNSEWPLYKHGLWWIPFGTDGVEGAQVAETLSLAYSMYYSQKQDVYLFRKILSRYAKLAEAAPEKNMIISTLVHPPETLQCWKGWVALHEIAADVGFQSITSQEAFDLLTASDKADAPDL